MRGSRQTLEFEKEKEKPLALQAIAAADLVFCLDFNSIARLEDLGYAIANCQAQKVLFDHHQQPEDFAAISISDTTYAATCEIVYDVIEALGDAHLIDTDIAENLYTGLATDTGFFQFNNTTQNVHRVAGALLTKGANPDYISDKVLSVFDLRRMRYYGFALQEKLRIAKQGRVAYISINNEDAKKFNLQLGDNDGLVNYPFKIEGVVVSVLFTEEKGKIKLSLRSKGTIDVNAFARQYFNGGGHKNASGGKLEGKLEVVEKLFLEKVEELLI